RTGRRSKLRRPQLHVERAIYMATTSQVARSTRVHLVTQRRKAAKAREERTCRIHAVKFIQNLDAPEMAGHLIAQNSLARFENLFVDDKSFSFFTLRSLRLCVKFPNSFDMRFHRKGPSRRIPPHYDLDDLHDDLRTVASCQLSGQRD
ncbi:MAG: hypothetical protein V3T83_06135, partial [Acidobacteriota bacterium]